MRGDIDERPSDAYNRPPTNLGLLQTTTNLNSPTSSSSPTMTTINDEHLKHKTIQDIFHPTRPAPVDTLSNSNSTAGPSFDFISMLEQLKQPRQIQTKYIDSFLFSHSFHHLFLVIILMTHWKFVVHQANHQFIFYDQFLFHLNHIYYLINQQIHVFQNIKRKCLNG